MLHRIFGSKDRKWKTDQQFQKGLPKNEKYFKFYHAYVSNFLRLRKHLEDPKNPPILILPEGTCINNTAVMQFKKGSFENDAVFHPIAVKYKILFFSKLLKPNETFSLVRFDLRFGDAFWNSSRHSAMKHLFLLMTSWALVCKITYLKPMKRKENESAIDFANRVKNEIAEVGGFVNLPWDGQVKRMKAKDEWKEKQQNDFVAKLKKDWRKKFVSHTYILSKLDILRYQFIHTKVHC